LNLDRKDKIFDRLQVEVNGVATDRDETTERVVLAADRVRVAGCTGTNTNDGYRSASNTNGDICTAEDDAQETSEGGSETVAGRLDLVAALDTPNIALASGCSLGGSKDGHGGSDDGSRELHFVKIG